MVDTGYQPGSAPSRGVGSSEPGSEGMGHDELRKQYLAYLDLKSEEIKEQQNARRYYHGSQWTADQIRVFNKRKQPVTTYNRIGRKINAIVGLLAKQRRDPRGFPRTEGHEQGAELATAVLRYVMDDQNWATLDPVCGLAGAIDGIGGVEITIEQGDSGDPNDHEIGLADVDPSGFFYDPRSMKADFSDARYMGLGKWADIETVVEMFPDKEEELRSSIEAGTDLTSNPDSDVKWFDSSNGQKKLRLVDHWYREKGQWRFCIYTGQVKLLDGQSPFVDEKRRTVCKFIMFSANVDQDGDRYGWVRNMKSSQDEINARRSKGLHLLNSRRMILEDGQGLDVEKTRTEAARPDGVIVHPAGTREPKFDDAARNAELQGQLAFLEDAKGEIENYGFNPALIGTGVQDMSGRAIQLQQQAGIAELGPYLLAYKGWKLRVYRAVWSAVQQHWTGERWVRVTDDEGVAQFFAVNKLGLGPNGLPAIINALGSLDVDIIIDEGPDSVNMQADAYDTLSIMAQKGAQVPPELLIELSPLQGKVKKKAMTIIQKAKQEAQQMQGPAMQAQMAQVRADVADTEASAGLKRAQTVKAMADARAAGATDAQKQQDRVIDSIERAEERDMRREEHAMDMRGSLIDLASKNANLQQQRERPQIGA